MNGTALLDTSTMQLYENSKPKIWLKAWKSIPENNHISAKPVSKAKHMSYHSQKNLSIYMRI
jgi:hypothetical protein